MKDRKTILLVQAIGIALITTQYFMIGATSGAVLNCVCLLRTVFFYFADGKIKSLLLKKYLFPTFFTILICAFAIFSWEGWYSIFILLCLAINSFCVGACNPQNLRKSMIFTCILAFIYNVYVFSIGGMANEILSLISALIGIIRYKKTQLDKTENMATIKQDE
jgi:hypothetical protein